VAAANQRENCYPDHFFDRACNCNVASICVFFHSVRFDGTAGMENSSRGSRWTACRQCGGPPNGVFLGQIRRTILRALRQQLGLPSGATAQAWICSHGGYADTGIQGSYVNSRETILLILVAKPCPAREWGEAKGEAIAKIVFAFCSPFG
jgi:hypothetical protein